MVRFQYEEMCAVRYGMSVAEFHLQDWWCNERIQQPDKRPLVLPLSMSSVQAGGIKVEFAFASGMDSDIYHLVVRDDMETLCGLKVSRLKSQQALHLVTEVSPRTICKHCERIQQNANSGLGC
jgi:hypothetical protein